jgi:release factor glutamine methyltransferase
VESGETTLADLMPRLGDRLATALGLESREARLETRILAAHALSVERAWLIAHDRDRLSPAQTQSLEAVMARRQAGEPVAYIVGGREFFGRLFRVTPDVLIPRPETELLVEAALERMPADRPARALDLGTGSGAVAITLALERPLAEISAVDDSPAALAIARDNARRLGAGRIEFIAGHWYEGLGVKKFDILVSNPPYIPAGDPHLGAGDLRFEPRQALSSGEDGLDAIRAIVAGAPGHLESGGWLLLEHGFDQAGQVAGLLRRGGFAGIATRSDLAGLARITYGRKPPIAN